MGGVSVLAGSAARRVAASVPSQNFLFGPELPTADIATYARVALANGFAGEKPHPLYLRAPDAKPQAHLIAAAAGTSDAHPLHCPAPARIFHRAAWRRTAAQRLPRCTARISSRPWTDGEFEQLIAQDTVFGFAGLEIGKGKAGPVGFVLARLAAGEAEILTLAVARSHRREGLGWRLMDAVLRELHAQRADKLFLEVDETNQPAHRALPPVRLSRGRQAPALLPVGRWRQIRRACHAARSSLARELPCACVGPYFLRMTLSENRFSLLGVMRRGEDNQGE